jgi:hypothetical protein
MKRIEAEIVDLVVDDDLDQNGDVDCSDRWPN